MHSIPILFGVYWAIAPSIRQVGSASKFCPLKFPVQSLGIHQSSQR
ncbi:MAG: hypothetical protein MUF49_26035 [Oculatellaceae cyanobacterium Prado106]|nr:hypothetical protein [Oculatellaceae cyanobacterium Prado106]